MENVAVDKKKRDQGKDHNKGKGYHGYKKNQDKDRRDRERVSSCLHSIIQT